MNLIKLSLMNVLETRWVMTFWPVFLPLISFRLPAAQQEVVHHLWHVLHLSKPQHPPGWGSDPPTRLHRGFQGLGGHLPLLQGPVWEQWLHREQGVSGPPESSPQLVGVSIHLEGAQHDGDTAPLAATGPPRTEATGGSGRGSGCRAPLDNRPGHDGGVLETESFQPAIPDTHPHSRAVQVRQPGQGAASRLCGSPPVEGPQGEEAPPLTAAETESSRGRPC